MVSYDTSVSDWIGDDVAAYFSRSLLVCVCCTLRKKKENIIFYNIYNIYHFVTIAYSIQYSNMLYMFVA